MNTTPEKVQVICNICGLVMLLEFNWICPICDSCEAMFGDEFLMAVFIQPHTPTRSKREFWERMKELELKLLEAMIPF